MDMAKLYNLPISVDDMAKVYAENVAVMDEMLNILELFVGQTQYKAIRFTDTNEGSDIFIYGHEEYTGLRCNEFDVLKVVINEEYEIDAEEIGYDELFTLYGRIMSKDYTEYCDYKWLDSSSVPSVDTLPEAFEID